VCEHCRAILHEEDAGEWLLFLLAESEDLAERLGMVPFRMLRDDSVQDHLTQRRDAAFGAGCSG
jgi:hypothetical protein